MITVLLNRIHHTSFCCRLPTVGDSNSLAFVVISGGRCAAVLAHEKQVATQSIWIKDTGDSRSRFPGNKPDGNLGNSLISKLIVIFSPSSFRKKWNNDLVAWPFERITINRLRQTAKDYHFAKSQVISIMGLPRDPFEWGRAGLCWRPVSVRPSVRHVRVLYPDGWRYCQTSFSIR